MKRGKTKICGKRDQGRICELDPGHHGMHRGQGWQWTKDMLPPVGRRRRRSAAQGRLFS